MLNWLAKTNAMWTHNDFAALDEITTAEMRTIYWPRSMGRACRPTRHGSHSS